MSQTGPNAFVVVGDTDWWSAQHRHVELAVDSRLRGMAKAITGAAFRSVCGNAVRAAAAQKRYAEFFVTGTNPVFGLCKSGAEASVLPTYPGAVAATVGYYGSDGIIYLNGTGAAQSGLPNNGVGDTIGLAYWLDGSTAKVQFYKNGATLGTPVSLTTGDYRLAASVYSGHVSPGVMLCVDRDDLIYLPEDCAPWGAAARVADAGGYSPVSSKIATQGNNIGVDAHLRCARDLGGADYVGDSARTGNASTGTALLYVEFLVEAAATAAKPLVGLCNTAFSMEAQYLGNSGTAAFGYYGSGGNVYVNNAVVATHASFSANDRIGVFLDPLSGKFWLSKNGAVQAGNPEAGTGQTGTLTGGPWFPAATPYGANARVRFATHAREQLYRPSYATAWDGADILPEQHYRGVLTSDTEMTQEISISAVWGKKQTGTPIGNIDISNKDGRYDRCRSYDLRDQDLAVYEVVDNAVVHWARGNVDSIAIGVDKLQIRVRGKDSVLDVSIPSKLFIMGEIGGHIPLVPTVTPLEYEFAQLDGNSVVKINQSSLIGVTDQGLQVTSWKRKPATTASQVLVRTVNPAGKQAVEFAAHFRKAQSSPLTLTNADFSSWSGDNPTGWSVTETGAANNRVTQNGNGARFIRGVATASLQIDQNLSQPSNGSALIVELVVSSWTSGSLHVRHDITSLNGNGEVKMTGAGTYRIVILKNVTATTLKIFADEGTDLTLDQINVWPAQNTNSLDGQDKNAWLAYLFQDIAGLDASAWSISQSSVVNGKTMPAVWSDASPTIRKVLDDMCFCDFASYYTHEDGRLIYARMLRKSSEPWSTAVTLSEVGAVSPVQITDDLAPALSDSAVYQPNFAVHSEQEVAGAASSAERAKLINKWLWIDGIPSTPTAHSFYKHAWNAKPYEFQCDYWTGTWRNWISYWSQRRFFFERSYSSDEVRSLKPMDTLILKADRFELSAGVPVMVVSKRRRLLSKITTLKLWG